MTRGVMLDLETMGTDSNAAIIAIGACAVDPAIRAVWGGVNFIVDLESSIKAGGVIDASTVMWWLQQSEEARAPYRDKGMFISDALTKFSEWCADTVGPRDKIEVWGNGSDFDNVVLGNTYRRLGVPLPWSFRNNRCYRTIKSLHPDVPFVRMGTWHNALDDALSQAHHLVEMFKQPVKG